MRSTKHKNQQGPLAQIHRDHHPRLVQKTVTQLLQPKPEETE